ncbi:hypothetical protein N7467_006857 [Penicillium canescens]|nr:hypothetical protein N7467_006857 [Penicillium canescens]
MPHLQRVQQHSAMSAARVVMNIAHISAYPIIAKLSLSDVTAGIFEAIGSTGFTLTQQVFVADMTSLDNRGVWSTLLDSLTTIPTLYVATIVAQRILDYSTWRCGWGMWAIVLPVAPLPFISTMLYYQLRAPSTASVSEALGWKSSDTWYTKVYRLLWIQLDLPGAVLLVAELSLLLIPLSLAGSNNSSAWTRGSFIAIPVLGVVFLMAFLVWDARFAQKPFRLVYKLPPGCWKLFCGLRGRIDFEPSILLMPIPLHRTNLLLSNSLRLAFQVADIFAAYFMKYKTISNLCIDRLFSLRSRNGCASLPLDMGDS